MDPLIQNAIISGRDTIFERQIEDPSIDILQVTQDQQDTLLHLAAKHGSARCTEIILEKTTLLLHKSNAKGDSPLHLAARFGHLNIVQVLLDKAEHVEVENSKQLLRMENLNKDTSLHEAVRNGYMEIVSFLLRKDEGLALAVNNDGESPLFIAVDRKYYEMARWILFQVPACSIQGRNGMNVLHASLLRTKIGNGPRRYVFMTGTFNCFISLIRVTALFLPLWVFFIIGSRPRASTISPSLAWSPRRKAPSFTYIHIGLDFIEKIMKEFGDANEEADKFGWIPMHYAAYIGNEEFVELLLGKADGGYSVAYKKEEKGGMSALHIAAKYGEFEFVRKMIDVCPGTMDLFDNKGRTALHVAARNGNIRVVKTLLSSQVCGSIVNERDRDGNTAFHLAALRGHVGVLLLLANYPRLDKGVVNNDDLTAYDIVNMSSKFMQHEKAEVWARGALKSLGQVVRRGNTSSQPSPNEAQKPGQVQQTPQETIARTNEAAVDKTHPGDANPAAAGRTEHASSQPSPTEAQKPGQVQQTPQETIASTNEAAVDKTHAGKANPTAALGTQRAKQMEGANPAAARRTEFAKETGNFNLIVATIIASVSFTATLTMSGGYIQGGQYHQSMAVLTTNPCLGVFVIANSFAFGLSTAYIFLHYCKTFVSGNYFSAGMIRCAAGCIELSIYSLVLAFLAGTYLFLADSRTVAIAAVATAGCCFILGPAIYIFHHYERILDY